MDRRLFLTTTAAGLFGSFAGCASGNSNPQGDTSPLRPTPSRTSTPNRSPTPLGFDDDENPFSDLRTDKSGSGFAQLGSVILPKHRHAHLKVDLPKRFHINGFVRSDGPSFDFFMMLDQELGAYVSGHEFDYLPSTSRLGATDATFEGEFPPKTYRMVFDNSGRGKAPPHSEVVIDFKWRLQPA